MFRPGLQHRKTEGVQQVVGRLEAAGDVEFGFENLAEVFAPQRADGVGIGGPGANAGLQLFFLFGRQRLLAAPARPIFEARQLLLVITGDPIPNGPLGHLHQRGYLLGRQPFASQAFRMAWSRRAILPRRSLRMRVRSSATVW